MKKVVKMAAFRRERAERGISKAQSIPREPKYSDILAKPVTVQPSYSWARRVFEMFADQPHDGRDVVGAEIVGGEVWFAQDDGKLVRIICQVVEVKK